MEMGDIAGGNGSYEGANDKVSELIGKIESMLGELKAAIGNEEAMEKEPTEDEGMEAPEGEAVTVAIGKKPYNVAPRSSIREKIAKMGM